MRYIVHGTRVRVHGIQEPRRMGSSGPDLNIDPSIFQRHYSHVFALTEADWKSKYGDLLYAEAQTSDGGGLESMYRHCFLHNCLRTTAHVVDSVRQLKNARPNNQIKENFFYFDFLEKLAYYLKTLAVTDTDPNCTASAMSLSAGAQSINYPVHAPTAPPPPVPPATAALEEAAAQTAIAARAAIYGNEEFDWQSERNVNIAPSGLDVGERQQSIPSSGSSESESRSCHSGRAHRGRGHGLGFDGQERGRGCGGRKATKVTKASPEETEVFLRNYKIGTKLTKNDLKRHGPFISIELMYRILSK